MALSLAGCNTERWVHELPDVAPSDPTERHIELIFGADAGDAKAVAQCESSMHPGVISDTGDYGLMQINQIHRSWLDEQFGWDLNDMLDLRKNLIVAKIFFDQQGWGPWYRSKNCHGLG